MDELNLETLSMEELNTSIEQGILEISQEEDNLHRLMDLERLVKCEGVCVTSMEALESIVPGSIDEDAPLYTFTANPSQTNFEVATESFFGAIGNAIKAVFKKIADLFRYIFRAIMSLFSSGTSDDTDKDEKKADKNQKRIAEIEERIAELRDGNDIPSSEELGAEVQLPKEVTQPRNILEVLIASDINSGSNLITPWLSVPATCTLLINDLLTDLGTWLAYIELMYEVEDPTTDEMAGWVDRVIDNCYNDEAQARKLLAYSYPIRVAAFQHANAGDYIGPLKELLSNFDFTADARFDQSIVKDGAFWNVKPVTTNGKDVVSPLSSDNLSIFATLLGAEAKGGETGVVLNHTTLKDVSDRLNGVDFDSSKDMSKLARVIKAVTKEIEVKANTSTKLDKARRKKWGKADGSRLVHPDQILGLSRATGDLVTRGDIEGVYIASDFPGKMLRGNYLQESLRNVNSLKATYADSLIVRDSYSNLLTASAKAVSKELQVLEKQLAALEKYIKENSDG